MIDGDCGLVGQVEEDVQVLLLEGSLVAFVHQLQHADDPMLDESWHTQCGARGEPGGFVEAAVESRVVGDVVD